MSLIVASVPERRLQNMRVVGYVRDGTAAGRDAPEERIRALASERGWEVLAVVHGAGVRGSGCPGDGLAAALAVLARDADALAVTGLDQLTGSSAEVTRLLECFGRNGWVLVVADGGADVLMPAEAVIREVRASRAADRRRRISAGTREAIRRRRAAGRRVGGPRRCPDAVLDRVLQLRDAGARQTEIAEVMNKAGLPTPGGGSHWWPSHVSRLLKTQDARARLATPSPRAGGG